MNSMQLEFFDVPSPCIGICQSDEKGHCLGCFRSRDERLNWTRFNSDDKQKVIKRCLQRKKRKSGTAKEKVLEQKVDIVQPSLLDPPSKTITAKSDDMDFGDFEL